MQEIPFSIPVSGIIRIDDHVITITVNRAETSVTFEPIPSKKERMSLAKGQTIFDILRQTALKFTESNREERFTAADLYREAVSRYPTLKRNSWTAHMIASAPNHPSQKHYVSKRNFFNYIGDGHYKLNPDLISSDDKDEEDESEQG